LQGVTPASISILLVYLKSFNRSNSKDNLDKVII